MIVENVEAVRFEDALRTELDATRKAHTHNEAANPPVRHLHDLRVNAPHSAIIVETAIRNAPTPKNSPTASAVSKTHFNLGMVCVSKRCKSRGPKRMCRRTPRRKCPIGDGYT